MFRKHLGKLTLALLALFVLMSCNLTGFATPQPTEEGLIYTQAAETFVVQMTEAAAQAVPNTPTSESADSSPTPTNTLIPSPTNTPLPSFTPLPSLTPLPTSTATLPGGVTPGTPVSGGGSGPQLPCNAAQFLKDVTVPDGTEFSQGESFTKTWRIKNVGSCTWTRDYDAVFKDGDSMGAPSGGVGFPYSVLPGQYVEISADLVAPSTPGTYRGDWMLRDASGRQFGVGSNNKPFYVEIEVVEADSGIVYNFARSYCSADWESRTSDSLECPGTRGDDNGFVIYLSNPNLEHRHEDEPTIWTNPDHNSDGYIMGTYPSFEVKAGDRFRAQIGCLADNPDCDVTFKLQYVNSNGVLKEYAEWHEVYDGSITVIDLELTSLVDKTVKFVFIVEANVKSRDNAGFWLHPQIYRPGS